jgi:nucleotide-binding universal stress UspA family protein
MALQLMVPLDGSAFSEAALGYAAEVAARLRATVHIVMVHDEANPRTVARDYLATVAADPRVAGLTPVTALLSGKVIDALEKYVRSCRIDLVVMSTHGRGGVSRVWAGSVADELLANVNVPVLLLRPEGAQPEPSTDRGTNRRHVLLPVDGSEFSESLIATAVAIGGSEGTQYTLLRVLLPPPPMSYGDFMSAPLPEYGIRDLHADAALQLLAVATRLRAEGLTVDTDIVVHTDVAAAIRTYALRHGVDLIAMVTHGLRGWKRLALGSVSDRVMRATSVPLVVLHPEPAGNPVINHI